MTLTMNWAAVWMRLFGTTTLWGLDLGFWAALAAVALIVIAMNLVFWGMKPAAPRPEQKETVSKSSRPGYFGAAAFGISGMGVKIAHGVGHQPEGELGHVLGAFLAAPAQPVLDQAHATGHAVGVGVF